MTRLTRLALDYPALIVLLMVALAIAGVSSALSLNQELVPDVQPPQGTIVVIYPGASAEEVERSVIEPIEDELENITDIDVLAITSTASDSFAAVGLQAEYGTEQDDIREEIETRLEEVDLPEEAEDPDVFLFTFADIPAIQVSISGDRSAGELQRLIEDELVPEIEKVEGVSRVSLAGDREDKVFLTLDPEAMEESGVTAQQIQGLLVANDISFPAGQLDAGGLVTPLQITHRITSTEALERLVVSTGDGPGGPAQAQGPAQSRQAAATSAPRPTATPRPRLAEGPFDIPASVQVQAVALGLELRDTDDLTVDLVETLLDEDPDLLEALATDIIESLPENADRDALPDDVIDALPEDLQELVEERTTTADELEDAEEEPERGGEVRIVQARDGDTLQVLATRFGVDADDIADANDLDAGEQPRAGQTLRIPVPENAGGRLPLVWRLNGASEAEEITPEIFESVADVAPEAINELTAEQLLALPTETVESLPDNFFERLEDDVREELAALAGVELEEVEDDAAEDEDEPFERREGVILLGDVADVSLEPDEFSTINRTNLQPSLGLVVFKDQDENTVRVVRDVEEKIEEVQDDVEALDDLEINTVFEQASFIEESLNGVISEGLIGGIFAILVILVFLFFSVRSTLIIAISIPLSLLAALVLMQIQGLSLNLLTLSGLTIAVGRVVDDSIVVLENVFRNVQSGERKRRAILRGTGEVANAITAATLITVAVFLPVGFVAGLTREFFLPLALTTSYALLASLLVAVTVIPLLAYYFLSQDSIPEDRETWLQRAYVRTIELALRARVLVLLVAIAFFVVSLGLLRFVPQQFIGGFGEPALTATIELPAGASLETTDAIATLVEDIAAADEKLEDVETTVGSTGFTNIGEFAGAEASAASLYVTFGELSEGLFDEDAEEPEDVAERFRDELAELNDYDEIVDRLQDSDRFSRAEARRVAAQLERVLDDASEREGQDVAPFTYSVSSQATGGPQAGVFDLQVIGEDEAQVREATDLILAALQDTEEWEDLGYELEEDEDEEDEDDESFFESLFGGDDEEDEDEDEEDRDVADGGTTVDGKKLPIINLGSNLAKARPVLEIDVDPELALEYGLTTAQVGLALRPVLEGQDIATIEIDDEEGESESYDVVIRYPEDTIADAEALEDYRLMAPTGQAVRLGDIATIRSADGAVEISRVDGERASIISGEILDQDAFGITDDALEIVSLVQEDNEALFGEEDDEEDDKPVVVQLGVGSTEQQDGFSDLLRALPISILIAYLIMVLEFGSLVVPLIVLFSLPFALSGSLFALAITQRPLSISALIGQLLLIGIVVTNAIVLLDFVQQLRRDKGMDVNEALIEGGRLRVRPIFMTALATVFALIPLSLGFTEGALIASELATVVIGGLITSTLLTLVVVPVVYSLLGRWTAPRERGGHDDDEPSPPGGGGDGGGEGEGDADAAAVAAAAGAAAATAVAASGAGEDEASTAAAAAAAASAAVEASGDAGEPAADGDGESADADETEGESPYWD